MKISKKVKLQQFNFCNILHHKDDETTNRAQSIKADTTKTCLNLNCFVCIC